MILVTGGAGFIGSNLIKRLNKKGIRNIIIVDNLENSIKHLNLNKLKFFDIIDKRDFINNIDILSGKLFVDDWKIEIIFHLGACTNTMEYNGRYMMENNYEFSKKILNFAVNNNIRFIYASSAAVYGDGSKGFKESNECESPLNIYGYSKLIFDNYVRKLIEFSGKFRKAKFYGDLEYENEDFYQFLKYIDLDIKLLQKRKLPQIVGLRYFNVYGPYEAHKNKMASVIYHFYNQIKNGNKIKLFEGSKEFKRDFIFVEDVIDVNMFFMDNQNISGIFNCGTGKERSFYDIALIMKKLFPNTSIEFIPFPEKLSGKYQKFTKADITLLKNAGYKDKFTSLEEGIVKYINYLENGSE